MDVIGIQPKLDDIVMFEFNDSGYSKELKTWKLERVTQVQPRKVTIEYVSKVSIQGISTMGSVSRNPRDISILFSTDELFINTPWNISSIYLSRVVHRLHLVWGFLDFKYFKSKLGVQSKKLYLLTSLKLKVFKTYFTIANYVSHAYCSVRRES